MTEFEAMDSQMTHYCACGTTAIEELDTYLALDMYRLLTNICAAPRRSEYNPFTITLGCLPDIRPRV